MSADTKDAINDVKEGVDSIHGEVVCVRERLASLEAYQKAEVDARKAKADAELAAKAARAEADEKQAEKIVKIAGRVSRLETLVVPITAVGAAVLSFVTKGFLHGNSN